MLDEREIRKLKAGMLKIWLIWMAMFISLFVMLIVVFVLSKSRPPDAHDAQAMEMITQISYGVALVILVVAYFLRKLMLRRAAMQRPLESASPISSPYAVMYMPAVVVSLAIAETIGAIGLTIFFLNRNLNTLLTFYIISIFGLFFFRPKFEEAEKLALAVEQNRDRRSINPK
jgi:hypothetical protein